MIKVFVERRIDQQQIPQFVPFQNLMFAVKAINESTDNLPIIVEIDKMKVGKGLDGIGAKANDCLVIYHAQHKKSYYSFVIIQEQIYSRNFVSVYLGGNSSTTHTITRSAMLNSKGTSSLMDIPSDIIRGIATTKAKKAQANESIYYELVKQLIIDAFQLALSNPIEEIPSQQENYRPQPQPKPQPQSQTQPKPQSRPVQNNVKTVQQPIQNKQSCNKSNSQNNSSNNKGTANIKKWNSLKESNPDDIFVKVYLTFFETINGTVLYRKIERYNEKVKFTIPPNINYYDIVNFTHTTQSGLKCNCHIQVLPGKRSTPKKPRVPWCEMPDSVLDKYIKKGSQTFEAAGFFSLLIFLGIPTIVASFICLSFGPAAIPGILVICSILIIILKKFLPASKKNKENAEIAIEEKRKRSSI